MTNKILAMGTQQSYGSWVSYVVPIGKSAVISKVVVFGRGSTSSPSIENFEISVNNGAGIQPILFRGKLALGETFELTGGITLNENETIQVLCDWGYENFYIDATIFGAEL